VSAVGADPYSPSTRLNTKWLGEQEVKNAYPDATIIRPCHIFGDYDNFVNRWTKFNYFFEFMPIINEGTELRQPIHYVDVA
jgi:NADH dehydrogenase (ubiquinone) 1 alpha subcomplex subunit 9